MAKENRKSAVDRDGVTLVIGDEVIVLQYNAYMHRCKIIRFTPKMIIAQNIRTGQIIQQASHYVMKASVTQTNWVKAEKSAPPKSGVYLCRYDSGFAREMCWSADKHQWEDPWEDDHTDDIVEWTNMPK